MKHPCRTLVRCQSRSHVHAHLIRITETINSFTGYVTWFITLAASLTSSLLALRDLSPSSPSLPTLLAHMTETNSPALHLLIGSASRGFLIALSRRIMHLDHTAHRALSESQVRQLSPSLLSAYASLRALTSSALVPLKQFEAMLGELSANIAAAYAAAGLGNRDGDGERAIVKERARLEADMCLGGPIPSVLAAAVSTLVGETADGLWKNVDPAALFFMDDSILDIGNKPRVVNGKAKVMVRDLFSKKPVRTDRRWKRCVRCAGGMEEVVSARPMMHWLLGQQRKCLCGGCWVSIGAGEEDAA